MIPNELIDKYRNRLITRKDIINKTKLSYNVVYKKLLKLNIEIWDRQRKNRGYYSEAIEFYQKKKFNRESLAEKFGFDKNKFSALLYRKGIYIWDSKKPRKIKHKKTSKYFNWEELKDHLMLRYNK